MFIFSYLKSPCVPLGFTRGASNKVLIKGLFFRNTFLLIHFPEGSHLMKQDKLFALLNSEELNILIPWVNSLLAHFLLPVPQEDFTELWTVKGWGLQGRRKGACGSKDEPQRGLSPANLPEVWFGLSDSLRLYHVKRKRKMYCPELSLLARPADFPRVTGHIFTRWALS